MISKQLLFKITENVIFINTKSKSLADFQVRMIFQETKITEEAAFLIFFKIYASIGSQKESMRSKTIFIKDNEIYIVP